jgi:superfamily II DNA or RNA helicase
MVELRPYQDKLVQDVRAAMRKRHNRIVVCAPTGSGKTVIFTYIVHAALQNGNRCLIITNRTELLSQAGGSFRQFGLTWDEVADGTHTIPQAPLVVAMVETLSRRVHPQASDAMAWQMWLRTMQVVIIDEVHIAAFDKLFPYFASSAVVLGFTATPMRYGKGAELADYFTTLVHGPQTGELVDRGYLASPRYFGVPLSLAGVRISGGEFDATDLQKLYTGSEVFGGLVSNLEKHGAGQKTIIFCPNVATSKQVAADLGCLHIDGTESPERRRRILHEYDENPAGIISNVGILTTGYDSPATSRIVLYRATKSLVLYMQMIGRGSRCAPGKDEFSILDFGNNVLRHGFWHTDRVWQLENDKTRKQREDKQGVYPIKDCPACGALVSVGVKICEYCGYEWVESEEERRVMELQEMEYRQIQLEMHRAQTVQEMEAIRTARGYKQGWLLRQLTTKTQLQEYAEMMGYKPYWRHLQAERYNITEP